MRYNSKSEECRYARKNRMEIYGDDDIRGLYDAGFTNGAIERIVNFEKNDRIVDDKGEKVHIPGKVHKIPAGHISRVVTNHIFCQKGLAQVAASKLRQKRTELLLKIRRAGHVGLLETWKDRNRVEKQERQDKAKTRKERLNARRVSKVLDSVERYKRLQREKASKLSERNSGSAKVSR